MPAPWEKYQTQPAAMPSAPQAPGVIRGAPDPAKQAAEARAQSAAARAEEAQALQQQRFQLDLAKQERAVQKEQRELEKQAKGLDATEGERNAAAFLIRALGSNKSYEGTGVGPRSLIGQAVSDTTPNLLNVLPGAIGNSPERQVSDSAQEEFIAASLRQDSGAAIPEEEMERQRRIYFPMPGDGPEAIEQKRQARLRAIAGLKQSSGRLLEPTLQEWQSSLDSESDEGLVGVGGASEGGDGPDGGLSFGGQREGFGDDGQGNPLVIVTDNGLQVLLKDTGQSAPQYGLPSGIEDIEDSVNPEAARYLKDLQQREKLDGTPDITDKAKSGITLGLIGESSGVGTAIGSALRGDFDFAENYTRGRDVEDIRIAQAGVNTGFAGDVVEVMGGGGSIKAAGNVAMNAGRQLAARGAPVTRSAIQGRMSRNALIEGAGAGAVGGFGYGEGTEGSVGNALLGGAAGGAIGRVGQGIGNRLANRSASGGSQVIQAADNLGIEPTPAVTGGTTTRMLSSGARQGFISAQPINKAVNRMETQAGAARDRIAAETGDVLDGEAAGDLVRQAANVYSKRTSEIGGKLYQRADARASGVKLPLPKAVQVADDELAQIAKAPGGERSGLYKDLKALRDDMQGGAFEIDGIRAFRSKIYTEMTERGLRGTPQDRAFRQVLDAAEEDLITGLQAAGKSDAAGALKTATAFWKKRVETIDEVLEPVLGKNSPKSGEQIVTALEALAKPKTGNAARLRGLFKAMPKDEQRAVSASIINRMGQPTPGSANLSDEGGFSFNTFLTNYNNLSPRAQTAMFPAETRDALRQLATVAKGVKEAGGSANMSNTANALTVQGVISGGLFYLEPLTAAAGALGQYGVGKLLASPKFARMLAGAPKADTPQARKAFSARLANLAKAEPAIANEINLYRNVIDRAANDNGARSALVAQEGEQQVPQN